MLNASGGYRHVGNAERVCESSANACVYECVNAKAEYHGLRRHSCEHLADAALRNNYSLSAKSAADEFYAADALGIFVGHGGLQRLDLYFHSSDYSYHYASSPVGYTRSIFFDLSMSRYLFASRFAASSESSR